MQTVTKLKKKKKSRILDQVEAVLPEGGHLNLCLTCGTCTSGCPVSGIENMDPRKFLRMAALGMDEAVLKTDWPFHCTLCLNCINACPMEIDIPQLVVNIREMRAEDQRPTVKVWE